MVLESVLVSFFKGGLPVFPAPLVKEIVFSRLYILASFVKDKVSIGAWIYLWAFYFVPLIYISVFVPVPYCLDDCGFVVEPEVRQVDSSSSILLSQDCFGYSRFFVFPYPLAAGREGGLHPRRLSAHHGAGRASGAPAGLRRAPPRPGGLLRDRHRHRGRSDRGAAQLPQVRRRLPRHGEPAPAGRPLRPRPGRPGAPGGRQ